MKLLPFGSVQVCPVCGNDVRGFAVTFSTDHVITVGNGRFVSTQTHDDDLRPHLEKHCPRCEFGWLEECSGEVTTK